MNTSNSANSTSSDITTMSASNAIPTPHEEPGQESEMQGQQEQASSNESEQERARRSTDPFTYYSDPRNVLRYLRAEDDTVQNDGPQEQQVVTRRRSVISFEVHPDLLLEDLLVDLR